MGTHADDVKQNADTTTAQRMIENDSDVLITTNRVVSIRYKIYFLLMILL
jgi:hypothetical protein